MSTAWLKRACGGVGTVLWTIAKAILMSLVIYNVYGFVWLLVGFIMERSINEILMPVTQTEMVPQAVAAAITNPFSVVICFVAFGYLWRSPRPWLPASAALIAVLGMVYTINEAKNALIMVRSVVGPPLLQDTAFFSLATRVLWLSVPLGPLSVFMGRALWTMRRDRLRAVADKPARSIRKNLSWQKWGILLGVFVLADASVYMAMVNVRKEMVNKPLDTMEWVHHPIAGRLLIRSHIDFKERERDGWTALHYAVGGDIDNVEFVKQLLELGANVQATTADGRTPLHEAAASFTGNVEMVKLLIERGADIHARDARGYTPMHRAAGNCSCKAAVAKLLIERGADIHAIATNGRTPLHGAAQCGNTATTKLLLDLGAVVDVRDSENRTPLHEAAKGGYAATAEALLECGADVNAKDNNGFTPLHDAAGLYIRGPEVVTLLIERGADVNAKDNNGHTPLQQAEISKQPEVAELLREHGAKE